MSVNLFRDLGYDESSAKVQNARRAAEMYSEVIDELVACRRDVGLSQKKLAKLMGTSQSAVSEFESASADARFSTVIRYAAAIDCGFVVEITNPTRNVVSDWVRLPSHADSDVIPFPATRSSNSASKCFVDRGGPRSEFNDYRLAGAL